MLGPRHDALIYWISVICKRSWEGLGLCSNEIVAKETESLFCSNIEDQTQFGPDG